MSWGPRAVVCPSLWFYLLDDPGLQHVRHDLQVDGAGQHVGRVSPEVRVSVRQNSFHLLDLEEYSDKA